MAADRRRRDVARMMTTTMALAVPRRETRNSHRCDANRVRDAIETRNARANTGTERNRRFERVRPARRSVTNWLRLTLR